MATSKFYNKSGLFESAAKNLLKSNDYIAIAHSAYYSCYMLMKHIWTTKMNKTDTELIALTSQLQQGSHAVLINQICCYMTSSGMIVRDFRNGIVQLREMRYDADYKDLNIDREKGEKAISLMTDLVKVLKKCA